MSAIYRATCVVGESFKAPKNVSFAWQQQRDAFSVWFDCRDDYTTEYIILGTGHEVPRGLKLRSSVVMPDGFHVFHLCEIP